MQQMNPCWRGNPSVSSMALGDRDDGSDAPGKSSSLSILSLLTPFFSIMFRLLQG
jgi:hypothetical protein